MEDITFVVHKEWLDNIRGLPIDIQDKVIADMVRYGVEMKMQHENDSTVTALVNMVKGRISFSKNKYEEKVLMSKKAGRKKVISDEEILMLAKSGCSAQEIAEKLGCTKTSVYHSEGWKNRK